MAEERFHITALPWTWSPIYDALTLIGGKFKLQVEYTMIGQIEGPAQVLVGYWDQNLQPRRDLFFDSITALTAPNSAYKVEIMFRSLTINSIPLRGRWKVTGM